jgi:outer membrane immunogenic protein
MTLKSLLAAAVTGPLGCASAFAAELPVKAQTMAAPVAYSWTGLYVGGHVGYGGGMTDWFDGQFDFLAKGFLGGGQIGVNQQIGNWVLGIEADASWANMSGSQSFAFSGAPLILGTVATSVASKIDRIVTVSGRLGFAQDRWLVYGKFGAAWAHETHSYSFSIDTAGPPASAQSIAVSGSENRFGPVFGFGAEYAFVGNWSAKLEYNHLNFRTGGPRMTGTLNNNGAVTPVSVDATIPQSLHLVKLGLNYRFDTPGLSTSIAPTRPALGFDWTGAYVGAQAGYGLERKNWVDVDADGRFNVDGWLAGGTAGANAQAGVFVAGAEFEWMWTGVKGGSNNVLDLGGGATQTTVLSTSIDWLAVASGRMGFVFSDRWMIYGKGGIAVASEKHSFSQTQSQPGVGFVAIATNGSALHTGYLVGVGIEHAFLGNWSAKLEYDYIGFRQQPFFSSGTAVFNIPGTIGTVDFAETHSIRQGMHLVKFGINYHFGAGPEVVRARY